MALKQIENKVILITGAASGIGADMAHKCLALGAKVCGLDLNSLPYKHENLMGVELDISNEEQINSAISNIINKHSTIDALVNNAGIQIISPLESFELSKWQKMFDVHINGSFLLSKACMNIMKNNNDISSIINIGSIHSFEASKNKSAYITAKHALVGLTRALAVEGAQYNIKANLVAPGFVKTPLVDKQIPEQARALNISEEEVVNRIMLGKTVDGQFTTSEEIIDAVLFFMQFPSLALTGQSLLVSHGQNMS